MANRKLNIHKSYQLPLPPLLTVIINLGIGLIIGYLGPFGTYQIETIPRIFYWVILIATGQIIYLQVNKFSTEYFLTNEANKGVKFIFPSLISAIILSFIVEYLSFYLLGFELKFPENFLFFFPKVFILGLALNGLGYYFNNAKGLKTEEKSIPGEIFLNRIPNKLGNDLICFCMEDHYLQVYTDKGSHMILLRMKDALIELKNYQGLQVHRSWWVAIDAVKDIKKQSRKATLIMSNNIQVPVSQKYLSALRDIGLF